MQFLRTVCAGIDGLNDYIGRAVAWTTLLLVMVTFVDVIMRYFFNTSYVFTQELAPPGSSGPTGSMAVSERYSRRPSAHHSRTLPSMS